MSTSAGAILSGPGDGPGPGPGDGPGPGPGPGLSRFLVAKYMTTVAGCCECYNE